MFMQSKTDRRICALIPRCLPSLVLLSAVVFGCKQHEPSDLPAGTNDEVRKEISLTEAAARQALVKMLEGKDAPNFDTRQREVEALKNGKHLLIMEKDFEGNLSDHWNCNLQARRFSFTTLLGSCWYNCYGIFETENGQWRARVTGSSWAKVAPEPLKDPSEP